MSAGLLLKGRSFRCTPGCPGACAGPGPVSAVLSALVVKTSVYLLYRLWFWSAAGLDREAVAWLLGLLGAGAVLYGSPRRWCRTSSSAWSPIRPSPSWATCCSSFR
jgi:multicomponent Na+:H+ antiporter subunit D